MNAVGNGCMEQFFKDHNVGHHPNPNPISVGPPTSDTSGSKVNGFDKIWSDADKCEGGWKWSIPWKFQVGSGAPKQFKVFDQVITNTATGKATISKGGASKSYEYTDASEKDPLFD